MAGNIELGKVWLSLGLSTRGLDADLGKFLKSATKAAATEGAKAGDAYTENVEKATKKADVGKVFHLTSVADAEGSKAGTKFAGAAEKAADKADLSKTIKDAAKTAAPEGTKAGEEFTEGIEKSTRGIKEKLRDSFKGINGRPPGETTGDEFEDGIKRKAPGIGSTLGGALKLGLVGLGAKLGLDFMGEFSSAVAGAADVEQSRGAVEAIFGGSAGVIQAGAKSAYADVGMSENAYNEAASMLGSQFANGGMDKAAAAEATKAAMRWGADVSSMFGGTPEEAVEAYKAGLRGEYEQLEKYGVSITADSLKAQMESMGMKKEGGEYSNGQKQAAMMAIVAKQTSAAAGNFDKEADTFSGKTVRMTAAIDNLKASLGEHLLPILSKVVEWISVKLVPWVETLSTKFGDFSKSITETVGPILQDLRSWFEENADKLKIFLGFVAGAAAPFAIYYGALAIGSVISGVFAGVTGAVAVAFRALNAAMKANPILFIVSLIAALVGGLIMLYNENEAFRAIVDKVWAGIKTAVAAVANWFMETLVPWFQSVWDAIKPGLDAIAAVFSAVWDGIRVALAVVFGIIWTIISTYVNIWVSIFQWVWSVVSTIFTAIWDFLVSVWNSIVTAVTPIIEKLAAFFKASWELVKTGVSTAFNAIKGVFSTIWNAIKGTVMGVVNPIKDGVIAAFDFLKDGVVKSIENLKSGLEVVWNGIKKVFKDPINAVIGIINDPFISNINSMMDKFGIGDKKIPKLREVSMATGGVLPGFTPGRDVHSFYSPTGGRLNLSGGEGIMRPEWVRAMGGPRAIAAMNDAAKHGRAFKNGGVYSLPDGAMSPRAITTYQGKTFTRRFAELLAKANKMAGGGMHISQGGFRPRTSYSGTSHQGDAADITGNFRKFIMPLRQLGIAAWDRTGKGNWAPHVHAIPTPGYGYGAGSAVWQAQDYLRGGDGLGGRDNGPRVKIGSGGNVAGYDKDGNFFSDMVGGAFDLIVKPVKELSDGLLAGKGVIGDMLSGSIDSILGTARNWLTGFKFDQGGYLNPGSTLTVNKTRKPEAILTSSQWSAISTVAARGMEAEERTTVNIETISLPGIKNWQELMAFAESLPSARRHGQMVGA